jgi:leader peptidase (prepilin peptidase) / N-methyltransferase
MSVILVAPTAGRLSVTPVMAVFAGAAMGGVASATTSVYVAITVGVWCGVVLAAALVDARAGRLPDVLVFPGIVAVLVLAILAGDGMSASAGAFLFAAPLLAVHLIHPGGLGFGDVKFAVLLGAGIGLVAVPLVVLAYLLAALGHACVCWVVRARRRLVPFGPALALASIMVVTFGLIEVS